MSILSVPSSRVVQYCQTRDECSQTSYNEITDEMQFLRSAINSTESNLIVFDGTMGGQIVHILANISASQQYIKQNVIKYASFYLVDVSKIQAVWLPNGVIMQMYRDILSGSSHIRTSVGM